MYDNIGESVRNKISSIWPEKYVRIIFLNYYKDYDYAVLVGARWVWLLAL